MTSKRKREREEMDNEEPVKRERRRTRSRSEPLMNDSNNSEKRQALKRLFGKTCSVGNENEPNDVPNEPPEEPGVEYDNEEYESEVYGDENEDPLLDSVPVHMDPEQLGFLLCAQETLRFLHGRGISPKNPMFSRLRSRLLRGIGEIAMA